MKASPFRAERGHLNGFAKSRYFKRRKDVGAADEDAVREVEEERRRNLEHNLRVLRYFAELAARGDPNYWRAHVQFINNFYRYVQKRLENPLFRKTYLKILEERKSC